MSFLIKPTNIRSGAVAPGIMSFAEKKELAIADAESRSSLSRSKNWSFSHDVKSIKDKQVKSRRQDDRD